MVKMMEKRSIVQFFNVFLFLLFVLTISSVGFCADEVENRTEQLEQKVTSLKEGVLGELKSTSELIELLKQRAMLKIKKKKHALLMRVNLFSAVSGGYETNVNNDSSNKGDTFNNEFVMLSWNPVFNKYFSLNTSALTYNQMYSDFTASSYLYSSFSTALRLYPFPDGKLRFEPGIGYETLWYPKTKDSSYAGIKYFLKTKNFLNRVLSLDLNYEFSQKEYDTRKARNPSGVNIESIREDERHSAETILTYRVGRYSIGLEGKVYNNTSNDLLQDLNDYYGAKAALNFGGSFLEGGRLYLNFYPSFERKNYKERLAVDTARYDDTYNWRFGAYYTLTDHYTLTYKVDYWSVDSNNTLAEYKNIIYQAGISARF